MATPPHRDPLRKQHAALVERVVLVRTALKGLSDDHAAVRRQLTRARAENDALRAALTRHGGAVAKPSSARRQREIAAR
jgi:hypothetical protein